MSAPAATDPDPLERLTALVRAQRGALMAAARAEGASGEDAVDCVEDALLTFLRLERAGELPAAGPAQIAAVFTMVRNAARNLRRSHRRSRPHDADVELAAPDDLVADELLARAEETVRLRACLAELCSLQRAVVTLRLLDERSGEDVAEELGLARGYVDVLVHRAKANLRACMRQPSRGRQAT